MTWLSLALALIKLLASFAEWGRNAYWMNEGKKQLVAQQIKDTMDALARAANVTEELSRLNETELTHEIERRGWYRD